MLIYEDLMYEHVLSIEDNNASETKEFNLKILNLPEDSTAKVINIEKTIDSYKSLTIYDNGLIIYNEQTHRKIITKTNKEMIKRDDSYVIEL